jgi:hypothetical protein
MDTSLYWILFAISIIAAFAYGHALGKRDGIIEGKRSGYKQAKETFEKKFKRNPNKAKKKGLFTWS